MTTAARAVLTDCEAALAEITHGVQGSAWRRRWINAVVLLRAVGHVLENVDAQRSVAYRTAIERAWKALQASKPEPAIFWQFIFEERNSILKEYRLAAGQGVTVRPGGVVVNLKTGEQIASPGLPPEFHYVMTDGPFKGTDQRDLLQQAITWWHSYLDQIEAEVAKTAP